MTEIMGNFKRQINIEVPRDLSYNYRVVRRLTNLNETMGLGRTRPQCSAAPQANISKMSTPIMLLTLGS